MNKTDVLSEVFQALHLRGELYFRTDITGAWAIEIPADRRKIRFHLVLQGRCAVALGDGDGDGGGEAVELEAGDLAVVPHGRAHVLADRAGRKPKRLDAVLAQIPPDEAGVLCIRHDGEGRVRLLCGFCGFDEAVDHPVLSLLPEFIEVVPSRLGGEPWLAAVLQLMAMEADVAGQGMNGILSRLLEVVFIQTVRARIGMEGVASAGYLQALSDPRLGAALRGMHERPETPWTLTSLARAAGMSRSVFVERFTASVGQTPIAYLTNWRLMQARRLLRDTALGTDEIGRRCGYASLPSFTRRFKAAFGTGPGAFRRDVARQ